jgi:hypothetical protein
MLKKSMKWKINICCMCHWLLWKVNNFLGKSMVSIASHWMLWKVIGAKEIYAMESQCLLC